MMYKSIQEEGERFRGEMLILSFKLMILEIIEDQSDQLEDSLKKQKFLQSEPD
jgi:hypothetical protein